MLNTLEKVSLQLGSRQGGIFRDGETENRPYGRKSAIIRADDRFENIFRLCVEAIKAEETFTPSRRHDSATELISIDADRSLLLLIARACGGRRRSRVVLNCARYFQSRRDGMALKIAGGRKVNRRITLFRVALLLPRLFPSAPMIKRFNFPHSRAAIVAKCVRYCAKTLSRGKIVLRADRSYLLSTCLLLLRVPVRLSLEEIKSAPRPSRWIAARKILSRTIYGHDVSINEHAVVDEIPHRTRLPVNLDIFVFHVACYFAALRTMPRCAPIFPRRNNGERRIPQIALAACSLTKLESIIYDLIIRPIFPRARNEDKERSARSVAGTIVRADSAILRTSHLIIFRLVS